MTQPELLFVMKVNKARHDKDFQMFLARSGFGERFLGREGTMGTVCVQWRGNTYITHHFTNLPDSPPMFGPI